jgi:hypothetical protein
VDWEPRAKTSRREGDPLADRLTALLGAGVAVRVVNVGGDVRRNLAVESLEIGSRRDAFVGRALPIDVTVSNLGPDEVKGAHLAVYADGDPTPVDRVEVPPLAGVDAATGDVHGRELVRVDLPPSVFRTPGSHYVHVTVGPSATDPEADALTLDTHRYLAQRARERIRVLAWAKTTSSARTEAETYLRGVYGGFAEIEGGGDAAASRVPPIYALETAVTEADFVTRIRGAGGVRPDLVVLANVVPRGAAADAVREHVREGGALLVFVGDALSDPAALNEPFHDAPDARLLPFPLEKAELRDPVTELANPFRLDFAATTGHELAAPFFEESATLFHRERPPAIFGRMTFRTDEGAAGPAGGGTDGSGPTVRPGEGRVVLRFADGKPAVVSGRFEQGKTLWVGTSVDEGWFSLAASFFLPVFLDEAALWLTRPEGHGSNLEVGERISTALPRDSTAVRVVAPGGAERVPTLGGAERETERQSVSVGNVGHAGPWKLTWRVEGARSDAGPSEEWFAVNVAPQEGRLKAARPERVRDRLPPEADIAFLRSWSEVREEASETRHGEITRAVLWALLGVLVLESMVAWLFGRRRSLLPEAGA